MFPAILLQLGIRTGPEQFVMFEPTTSRITPDIPLEGIVLRNGWSIIPTPVTRFKLTPSGYW